MFTYGKSYDKNILPWRVKKEFLQTNKYHFVILMIDSSSVY